MIDILIQNGLVVDGKGGDSYSADVAVDRGRILQVGELEGSDARTVIDATGCVVAPGFVDMHSHSDFSLPANPTADSLVQQGITTTIVGNCGASPAPLLEGSRHELIDAMESEDLPLPWEKWSTFESYLAFLSDTGMSLNIVPLVGHSTIRAGIVGYGSSPPNAAELDQMRAEVVRAIQGGARGLSTGLIYPPGSFATTEELIELTRPVAELGGLYFSHIRGEASTLLQALREAIRIGRETGASVEISHFKAYGRENWEKATEALDLIHGARAEGLDVTADMYPYLAGSLGLVAMLPQWAQEGGREATLKRLRERQARRQMTLDMETAEFLRVDDWRHVIISSSPRSLAYEGQSIASLAAEEGKSPHEWIYDALVETDLQLDVVEFGMCEENRKMALRQPFMMLGTDGRGLIAEGPLCRGAPHPRNYGAFPRVLGHYVREEGVISLEEAVWRMSGLPAKKLRWRDRGLVKAGQWADLVVFDPDTVEDRATYEEPHQYPVGIEYVIVNGEVVIDKGVHNGLRPGKVL